MQSPFVSQHSPFSLRVTSGQTGNLESPRLATAENSQLLIECTSAPCADGSGTGMKVVLRRSILFVEPFVNERQRVSEDNIYVYCRYCLVSTLSRSSERSHSPCSGKTTRRLSSCWNKHRRLVHNQSWCNVRIATSRSRGLQSSACHFRALVL